MVKQIALSTNGNYQYDFLKVAIWTRFMKPAPWSSDRLLS